MNPMNLMKLKGRFDTFKKDHPKVMPFVKYIKNNAVVEGTVVEISVETPGGERKTCNIRLTANDIETIRMI